MELGFGDGKVGLAGTAICRLFLYCLIHRGLITLSPFFSDSGKTISKGLELGKCHFHLSPRMHTKGP